MKQHKRKEKRTVAGGHHANLNKANEKWKSNKTRTNNNSSLHQTRKYINQDSTQRLNEPAHEIMVLIT